MALVKVKKAKFSDSGEYTSLALFYCMERQKRVFTEPHETLGELLDAPVIHVLTHHLPYFNGVTHAGQLTYDPYVVR